MNTKIKDRHLLGAGAAACAICCAPPLLAVLGIAGAGFAASIATVAFAGLVFGVVVLVATLLTVWARSRNRGPATTCADDAPVELTLTAPPGDAADDERSGR